MADIGALYTQAKSDWDALSVADRLQSLGYHANYDEGSVSGYANANGEAPATNAADFNSADWFNKNGIISLDPRFSNNAQGETPDMNAKSYGFANADAMLQHITGPGQYVDDPTIGRYWDPQQKDSQKWDINFIGQQNQQNIGPVGRFLDRGGLITTLAGMIAGAGAADLFNGGANPLSNFFKGASGAADVPIEAGQNLVNNPSVFGNANAVAGASAGGIDLLQAAKTASTILSPLSSILKGAAGAASVAGAAGAVKVASDALGAPNTVNGPAVTPPVVTPPVTMPTTGKGTSLSNPLSPLSVARQSVQQQTLRRGRASTILTSPNDSDLLGA